MATQRIRLSLGNVKAWITCLLTEDTGLDITTVTVDLIAFGGWDSPNGCDGDLNYEFTPTSVMQIDDSNKQVSLFVDGTVVNPGDGTYTMWVHAVDSVSGAEDWVRSDEDTVIISGANTV